MAELRWNPLLRDWVMIASHRQERPQMPTGWCPFCPGAGRVPDGWDVLKYDNDFPALSLDPPPPDVASQGLLIAAPAVGKCEVILYSPDHTTTLPRLPLGHVRKLVDLWCERYAALSADERVKFVFIFENRGEAVGVTMPHPHGQIYAYGYIPKKLELELGAGRAHHAATGRCLVCDVLADERRDGRRVIFEDEHFTAVLPFFTEYPYGVWLIARRHVRHLGELDDAGRTALAAAVKAVTATLDGLFDCEFPYMMAFHQAPSNCGDHGAWSHLHVELYPPMRSATKLKYNASSETGAWAPCNPTAPEEKAAELRAAWGRVRAAWGEGGGESGVRGGVAAEGGAQAAEGGNVAAEGGGVAAEGGGPGGGSPAAEGA